MREHTRAKRTRETHSKNALDSLRKDGVIALLVEETKPREEGLERPEVEVWCVDLHACLLRGGK